MSAEAAFNDNCIENNFPNPPNPPLLKGGKGGLLIFIVRVCLHCTIFGSWPAAGRGVVPVMKDCLVRFVVQFTNLSHVMDIQPNNKFYNPF
jgi:hypothetical protein